MFLQNKYTTWYYNIIRNASNRVTFENGYFEKHHIVPRSLGGDNTKTNLAKLTAREHFICHLLLTKMCSYPAKYKMDKAMKMMVTSSQTTLGRCRPSGRWVEYARKHGNASCKGIPRSQEVKDAVSKANTGRVPWNKGKKMNAEFCETISLRMKGKPAWNAGVAATENRKEKQRAAMLGRTASDETKKKMSIAKKGKPPNNKGKGKHQLLLKAV